MAVEKVTAANFDAFLATDAPVLLDFYADWCGPCRMLAPVLETLAAEIPELKIGKINVDEEGALAARFGISSIPFVARFENGTLTHSAMGFMPASLLKSKLGI